MTNLKDVQKDPKKLAQFIKEREKETPPADKDRFDAAMKSMASQKSSKDQKSSDYDLNGCYSGIQIPWRS